MFDLISIGDCVIDTYIPLLEAELIQEKDKSVKKLAFEYGNKIPVGPSVSMVAGNAANNAVGAARLGFKTAIYTNVGNLGDDRDDDRIIKKLKKEKVDIRYVIENDDLPTNHNVVLSYKGDRTILVCHQPWKFDLPDLDKTKWIYLTSMSPTFVDSSIMEQIVNYLERSPAKLVFSPGTFQIKHGVKKYPRLLSLAELIVVNFEEALIILGIDENSLKSPKDLLKALLNLGPRKAIITDGANGSFGTDGERFFMLEAYPAKLVEMTGAGDAYATGFVAGLFYNEPIERAMRWGAVNSASVVEHIGPQEGLMTADKIRQEIKDHNKFLWKEIK